MKETINIKPNYTDKLEYQEAIRLAESESFNKEQSRKINLLHKRWHGGENLLELIDEMMDKKAKQTKKYEKI